MNQKLLTKIMTRIRYERHEKGNKNDISYTVTN